METIICADNVTYKYEDGTYALRGVTLNIGRGQKIAFMGANGSGKSTFFLTLNGIHKPHSGSISFKGNSIEYSRKDLLSLRSKIGIVFQDPDTQLFSSSVYQEISFGILNLGKDEAEAKMAVENILSDMSMEHFKDKPTHALSGGEKKQVAIADILVMDPEVIILDEPTSNLDPRHTRLVNDYIDRLTKRGITVLISTHDMDYAYRWADEIIVFHEGCVEKQGTPKEILQDRELLKKTNLELPAMAHLFLDLKEKKLLREDLPLPDTLEEIEEYIINELQKGKNDE